MNSDLIVIGAGILGLATAWRAHASGRQVTVVDAHDRPTGASVQNFGHAAFTVQEDEVQAVAERARKGWSEAAAKAGLWASQPGTWVCATTELEMQVLEEFAAHRGSEQVRLVSAAEVAEALGNPELDCVGGAHLPLDMRVNPRAAPQAIADHLSQEGVTFCWNAAVREVSDGVVDTSRGRLHADQVIVCPGTGATHLFPELAQRYELTTCRLAMALVDNPGHTPADLAMLTGTGIARYGGLAALPSAPQLRAELARTEPELTGIEANVMATAIPEGVLIGDSHSYARSPFPFIDAHESDLLLTKASAYLGIAEPVVRQRWLGQYPYSPQTNLVVHNVDKHTTVGVMTTGSGMTLSFGLAELFLEGESIARY